VEVKGQNGNRIEEEKIEREAAMTREVKGNWWREWGEGRSYKTEKAIEK